jgi:hypothetical protein
LTLPKASYYRWLEREPVDILDGYSSILVHWSLNRTMLADTVPHTASKCWTVCPIVDQESPRSSTSVAISSSEASGAPSEGKGLNDVKTRVAYPQSNGCLERLHRTHREEGHPEELSDYYQALAARRLYWQAYANVKERQNLSPI